MAIQDTQSTQDQQFKVAEIRNKLDHISTELTKAVPNILTDLKTIHRTLQEDQDIVTILTDEEIGMLCAGLSKQSGIELGGAVKRPTKATLAKLTADDL